MHNHKGQMRAGIVVLFAICQGCFTTPTTAVGNAATGCPADMAYVPAGSFSMGTSDDAFAPDEKPAHRVTLSAYCVDRTEVTVKAFAECVRAGKCPAPGEPSNASVWDAGCNGSRADRQEHPVNCVDWEQSATYCSWMNKRLPTEAEWERAARGDDGRMYPWGNQMPTARHLNACGQECKQQEFGTVYTESDRWAATAPVASYPDGKSPYGADDMAGNVWEWTSDWFGSYSPQDSVTPNGPVTGNVKVYRGGGWNAGSSFLVRTVARIKIKPEYRSPFLGFRCGRSLNAPTR
ncbi:MAG: SUMF1/EgtB/PvdO family nonheme iron enzyme [Gemmatimonadaceae bacterium]|nr:SUMF1/EgtB/PvdO family nonheme iron enzyme [Gemmatimonadaceae bacterium]